MRSLSDEDRQAHSIIYMTDTRPYCTPEEERVFTHKPIAVRNATADQKLHPMSRINFKTIYKIDHDEQVMNIGMVVEESLHLLIAYRLHALE
jgi:hypothetical protein